MKVAKVYARDVIERAQEPNRSPILRTATFRDDETGSEIDVTIHEDKSITVIAERLTGKDAGKMSERLSDEQLEGMMRWYDEDHLPAYAMYCGPLAAKELRERRAADLSGDDLSVLSDLRVRVRANQDEWPERIHQLHLAALDRLLSRGKDGR